MPLYANFLTHHWIPDPACTWVHYTIGAHRYRMPLVLSFALIGFFLWLAENVATYLGAWTVSWALLISVTFVICGARRNTTTPPADSSDRGRRTAVSATTVT